MRENTAARLRDIHNCLVTPPEMEFTENGYPVIQPTYEVPEQMEFTAFHHITKKKPKHRAWVHFWMYDWLFERIWSRPEETMKFLKPHPGVVSPDFSMFMDIPVLVSKWNKYRNQWLGAYWQINGITVIPNIGWMGEDSYEWCFEGLPEKAVVAISTLGCLQNKETREYFMKGYQAAIDALQPKLVLLYTSTKKQMELFEGETPVRQIPMYRAVRRE